jgi:hypothetical protein
MFSLTEYRWQIAPTTPVAIDAAIRAEKRWKK